MKIIKNCYDKIGMFDSKVGETYIINDNLIIPVSNIQIDADFEGNIFNKIAHLDYCYLIFIGVIKSYRDVYYLDSKYEQCNFIKNNYSDLKTEKFEMELVNVLNFNFQYLWTIESHKFLIGIPNHGTLREDYLSNEKLDLKHFFNIKLSELEITIDSII